MGIEFSRAIALSYLENLEKEYEDEVSIVRIRALRESLFKKLVTLTDVASLEEAAFSDFIQRNDALSQIKLVPSIDISHLRDEMSVLFPEYLSVATAMNYGYCGPGSSVLGRQTNFFTKMFDSSLTSTSSFLHKTYTAVLSPSWYMAESFRHRLHGSRLVAGSKLCSVPKDDTKRRVICVEPTLNMFAQLGAKVVLERYLLEKHNINMSNQQDINRRMAKSASISGRFATLDLKNASDSISLALCNLILPTSISHCLYAIRSPKCDVAGQEITLNMISTMGNGTTFPLMTAILSCAIRVIYQKHGIHPRNGVNYAVFGDDLIVLTDLSQEIVAFLNDLGFFVNTSKSFFEGPFRESCGGDYWKGFDVRGVFLKSLKSDADKYSSFNRLMSWSCRFGIDISPILYMLKPARVLLVPGHSNGDSGIISPLSLTPRNSVAPGLHVYRSLVVRPTRYRLKTENEQGSIISFIGGYIRDSCITNRQKTVRYQIRKCYTPHWDAVSNDTRGWFDSQAHVETLRDILISWGLSVGET